MKRYIWISAIAIYVGTLIIYHRFEDSKNVLDILGNIPTFLSSLTTAGAFIVAAITYNSTKKRQPSQQCFEVYNETLNDLKCILRDPSKGAGYKLYNIGIAFDSLKTLNSTLTEEDHRNIVLVKYVAIQREIEILLRGIKVHDYFCNKDVPYDKSFSRNITSSADALYDYWYKNVSGKSSLFKFSRGIMDSFASHPYGIEPELLIKALTMCCSNLNLWAVYLSITDTMAKVDTCKPHELIFLSDNYPETVAYLLLSYQTQPLTNKDGKVSLTLKSTYNDRYWLNYQMTTGSWLRYEIPKKISF